MVLGWASCVLPASCDEQLPCMLIHTISTAWPKCSPGLHQHWGLMQKSKRFQQSVLNDSYGKANQSSQKILLGLLFEHMQIICFLNLWKLSSVDSIFCKSPWICSFLVCAWKRRRGRNLSLENTQEGQCWGFSRLFSTCSSNLFTVEQDRMRIIVESID